MNRAEERDKMLSLLQAKDWALSSATGEPAAILFAIFGPFSTLLLG
jgi:hypothetical protein